MPDLRQTRDKLKIAIAGVVLLDVILVVVLFSPLVGSEQSRDLQASQLHSDLLRKTREVKPLQGLDKKIPLAQGQIDSFYKERLPSQDSAISGDLNRLASQAGVKIGAIKYAQKSDENNEKEMKTVEAVGLQRVMIEAELSGDYLPMIRFVNALERNQLFFLVDSVELGGEQAGVIRVNMRLETYLKTGG
jgi:type IV pilus assembly protein PilO